MTELNFLQQECKQAIYQKDFGKALTIYEKLFNHTKDYNYKLCIANIYLKVFGNIPKATAIFEEIKEHLNSNIDFWWQYHEIQRANKNVYGATLSVRKVLDLELCRLEREKNA